MSVETEPDEMTAKPKDSLLSNAALLLATTLMMAGGGAVFWVVAARLQTPHNVGIAGSLVAAAESIALFAQLGLNIALVRTMPTSTRKAADVFTAGVVVVLAGAGFTLAYCLLLPLTSPSLAAVLGSPLVIAVYCLLVAATALNVLTDSVFLSLDRLWDYLRLNGILMSLGKCVLPFLLGGAGAFGLYGAFGTAVLLCAVASLWVIFRHLPGPRSLTPSQALLDSRRFAGAGYASYVLAVLPLLIFPLLIINVRGASDAAVYFISFQLAALLNAMILAVANSTYAECERNFADRRRVVRKGGLTLMVASVGGALAMVVIGPYLLHIFGDHYADEGATILRVLALATVGAAFNYWSALRLRLSRHLRAMVLVQLLSTAVMLGLAWLLVEHGTVWVGAAWGIGHLVGGLVGYLASITVARYHDEGPRVRRKQDVT